jgi:hypothetical protein
MHVRHETLFRWLERAFPGGKLYGPYNHGGREYFQWMVRGAYLRDEILPILDLTIGAELDAHTFARLQQMKQRYPDRLGQQPLSSLSPGVADIGGRIGYVTDGGDEVAAQYPTTATEQ